MKLEYRLTFERIGKDYPNSITFNVPSKEELKELLEKFNKVVLEELENTGKSKEDEI